MKKNNFFKKFISFAAARYAPRGGHVSFSSLGEDLIMRDLLNRLGVEKVFYIDIGAHHPVFGNNTFLFYRNGGRGILVEPNPLLAEALKKKRPHDQCLVAGAGGRDATADFFLFPDRTTRSTFSHEQAQAWERSSGQQAVVRKCPILSLDSIIDRYGEGRVPDIVSIDAEGLDIDILSNFSFRKRPKIFCVESASCEEGGVKSLDARLYPLMEKHGYVLSAKISYNAIFVDSRVSVKNPEA